MLPEELELLFIPVLMNEIPLKRINDEEAAKIASVVKRMIPLVPEAKVVIIPALYYLSDILGRMTLDEILVNSAALVEIMEKRGIDSNIYVFNPYSSNGMIPIPMRFSGSTGGSAWAVIPVLVFGSYVRSFGYEPSDEDEPDYSLEDLESIISTIYGIHGLKVFPLMPIEDLIELINYVEVVYGSENLDTSAG